MIGRQIISWTCPSIQVSPVTMHQLGSTNLFHDIRGMRTSEFRSMVSCTLVSVGGEFRFQERFWVY